MRVIQTLSRMAVFEGWQMKFQDKPDLRQRLVIENDMSSTVFRH